MSGVSFANKIEKMSSKLGKKLGLEFNIYRSVDYLTPISAENYLATKSVSFTIDASFTKPQTYDFSLWNIYADYKLQVGDVLQSIEVNPPKMFVVVGKDLFSPIQGLSANSFVSFYRPSYSATSGSFAPSREEIFIEVPAVIIGTNSSSDSGPASVFPTKQAPKNAVLEWDVWCWLPSSDALKPNDILISSSIEGTIKSIQYSELGYKLRIVSSK